MTIRTTTAERTKLVAHKIKGLIPCRCANHMWES